MFNIAAKTAIAAALYSAGLFAAPTAFAASTEVRYKDLDLGTAEGQKALQKRINSAAREVCRYERPAAGTLIRSGVDDACYAVALRSTREQVAAAIDKADNTRLGG